MVRQLLGNCDNLIFDGYGVVIWVEIQDATAFEPQIMLAAFDCALGCGVVLDTASVSKLTKTYHRFNDAARHDIPLLFFFQMRAKTQFHNSLSTHTAN